MKANADGVGARLGAGGLAFGIKRCQAFSVEPLVHTHDGRRQRLMLGYNLVPQKTIDEFEKLSPFAKIFWQAGRQKGQRLSAAMASTVCRSVFKGKMLSRRVVMSRVVLRPPCRKGRRSCSRQASSMTRRSPIAQGFAELGRGGVPIAAYGFPIDQEE